MTFPPDTFITTVFEKMWNSAILPLHFLANMSCLKRAHAGGSGGFPCYDELPFHLRPQTILIDRAGKVEKAWTGILNDSAMAELKQRPCDSKAASQNSDNHPALSLN